MIKVGTSEVTFPYSKIYVGDTQVYPTPQALSPYLESDGTQSIVTGLSGISANNRIEFDFKFLSNSYTDIVPYLVNGAVRRSTFGLVSPDFYCAPYPWTMVWDNGLNKLAEPDTNRHLLVFGSGTNASFGVYFDGVQVAHASTGAVGGSVNSFNVFNTNCSARIYSLKVYNSLSESSGLLLDLVPTLDGNNVPCLHDNVSGTNYYDSNGGTFVYGEE